MTIEKLKSGSYRIRQMYEGKVYRVTVPYKPTQKEATILIANKMASGITSKVDDGSIGEYAEKFIDKCEKSGHSPNTIRGYDIKRKHTPEWFKKINIFNITEQDMQKVINEYGVGRSPKTVKQMYGFWHAVLAEYRPQFTFKVKLPTVQRKMEYEPTTADIKAILEATQGSRYDMLLELCTLGLRRGEAMVITAKDIDENNVISITKDIVIDKNNKVSIKDHPKTSASYRRIPISHELADKIRKAGQVYTGSPHAINKHLSKLQSDLNIPHFRLHMLRHFAAAFLHSKGCNDEQVMTWMGYDDPSTMQRIYRYNLDPHKSLKTIQDFFTQIRG